MYLHVLFRNQCLPATPAITINNRGDPKPTDVGKYTKQQFILDIYDRTRIKSSLKVSLNVCFEKLVSCTKITKYLIFINTQKIIIALSHNYLAPNKSLLFTLRRISNRFYYRWWQGWNMGSFQNTDLANIQFENFYTTQCNIGFIYQFFFPPSRKIHHCVHCHYTAFEPLLIY